MCFFFPVHLIIYRYNKVQTPLFLSPPINRSSLPPLFSSPGRLMRSDNKHCRPLLPSLFSAHHSKIQEVLAPAHQQLSFHPRPPPPSPEPRWREDHEKIRTKSTDSSTSGCGKRLAPWYLWVTALQYLWVRVQYDDLKSLIACTAVLLTGECSSVWWGCPFRGEVCEGKRGAEVSGCVNCSSLPPN